MQQVKKVKGICWTLQAERNFVSFNLEKQKIRTCQGAGGKQDVQQGQKKSNVSMLANQRKTALQGSQVPGGVCWGGWGGGGGGGVGVFGGGPYAFFGGCYL